MKLNDLILLSILDAIKSLKDLITMNQAQMLVLLTGVATQQQKTIGEIQALQGTSTALGVKVAELQAIIAQGGTISPELEAVVNQVAQLAQQADDQIPDTPPVVVVPEPDPAVDPVA